MKIASNRESEILKVEYWIKNIGGGGVSKIAMIGKDVV